MELNYGIEQPLRIYESIEDKNAARENVTEVFDLICPVSRLLPFQIRREAGVSGLVSINLKRSDNGALLQNIVGLIDVSEIETFYLSDGDVLVHFGLMDLIQNLPTGRYYLELSDGVNTWYTEDILFLDFDPDDLSTSDCVQTKIEYWDTCDVGNIFYRTELTTGKQYKNVLYLDIEPGKSGFAFYEQGDEDADGTFEADLARVQKNYVLEGVFPEFMLDALASLAIHKLRTSAIDVTTSKGYTGRVVDIEMSDPDWKDTYGSFALSGIQFNVGFQVKKNCCGDLDELYAFCLRDEDTFLCVLQEGTAHYNNFTFYDNSTEQVEDLQNGDYVMALNAQGKYVLQMYQDSSYVDTPEIVYLGKTFVDLNGFHGGDSDIYYYFTGSGVEGYKSLPSGQSNTETVPGTWLSLGTCWENCTVRIIAAINGNNTLVEQSSGGDFNAGGIVYQMPAGTEYVFTEYISGGCTLYRSKYTYISGGIGFMRIGTTFVVSET